MKKVFKLLLPALFISAMFVGCSSTPKQYSFQEVIVSQEAEVRTNDKISDEEQRSIVVFLKENTNGNMLFRGNTPVSKGIFDYEKLETRLEEVAAKAGKKLPQNHKVVVVTLLNGLTPKENEALVAEKKYFQDNAEKGYVINNPIFGALVSPNKYPTKIRKKLEKITAPDHMEELTSKIQNLLVTKNDVPTLIYIHCMAGKDRTGEVVASYNMKYSGISYKDAYADANVVADRKITDFSKYGLQWYGYYLIDYQKVTTIGEIK